MKARLVALVLVLVTLAPGCGSDASGGPPAIEYGRDVCTACNMILSDPRYAAAYRDGAGDPALFDDVGEMVEYAQAKGVLDEVTAWVHDYETEEWLDAPDAWFVRAGIETPMASGVVAFADEADARAFADDHNGEVLRWPDLVARADEMGPGPMTRHGLQGG